MCVTILGDPSTEAEKALLAGQKAVQGKQELQMLYVPANTVKGEVLARVYDGDEETNPKAIQPATSSVYQKMVVATQDQGATAGFQWCVIEGECDGLVNGTTDVAKDDFLEVLNGTSAFVKDATSRSTNSGAIAREAVTANANTLSKIYLFGERSIVAAS